MYFTDEAINIINDFYMKSKYTDFGEAVANNVEFIKLDFLNSYDIDEYNITPFRGSHNTAYEKNSANYLIKKDAFKLYYALDSGYFTDETFEALKDAKLDAFIGEFTFPDFWKSREEQKNLP